MVIDFTTLYNFPNKMDKLVDEIWNPSFINRRRAAYPPLNLSEDAENIYVRAEMPGVAMENIELTLANKSLIIKGERTSEQGRYFRQERPAGDFQRIITLNVPVNRETVKATMADGLLTVVLPKSEDVKPKTISIEVE